MKKVLIIAAALMISPMCMASVLNLGAGTKSVENVSIANGATVSATNVKMNTLGAGLRSKKKLGMNFKVYVAQLFGTGSYSRSEDGVLASVAAMSDTAITLSFLRSVDAPTIESSFREALIANNVNLNTSEMTSFLAAVKAGGDADTGNTLTIVGHTSANGDTLTYEDTKGRSNVIKGGKSFVRNVLAIWLGQPSDDGVAALKKQLLQKVY